MATMTALRHRLPQADDAREARDSVITGTQHAIEQARDAVNSALDNLPAFSLHDLPLPDSVSRLGPVKRRRRSGPPWLVLLGVLAVLGGGAFVAYRWLTKETPADYGVAPNWPNEPSTGNRAQPPESDAAATEDAADSLAVRGTVSPAEFNGPR